MRIIAGEYRGRVLKSPNDYKTRPTSDRLRETLLNILSPKINTETRFLDLCAGTGAVGIEAISRGAGFSAFVDKSRRACGLIKENLDLLRIPEDQTEIICNSAENFVSRISENVWDIIFYDPPYKNEYSIVIQEIGSSDSALLTDGGNFVVEHHFKNNLPDAAGNIKRRRIVKQGENCLSFYEKG